MRFLYDHRQSSTQEDLFFYVTDLAFDPRDALTDQKPQFFFTSIIFFYHPFFFIITSTTEVIAKHPSQTTHPPSFDLLTCHGGVVQPRERPWASLVIGTLR